jgi:hypothetical protein
MMRSLRRPLAIVFIGGDLLACSSPAIPTASDSGEDVTTVADASIACPSGMIAWWKGDDDTSDKLGQIPLSWIGNARYSPQMVGHGFRLFFPYTEDAGGYLVGSAPPMQLDALSIEGWVSSRELWYVPGFEGSPPVERSGPEGTIVGTQGWWFGIGIGGSPDAGSRGGHLEFAPGGNTFVEGAYWGTGDNTTLTSLDWTQPQHVAMTYDPANGAIFYVNGQRIPTMGGAPGPLIGNNPLVVGRMTGGALDELTIYRVALTEEQIQAIVAAGSKGKCSM